MLLNQLDTIVLNIDCIDSNDKSVIHIILKCLNKRGVTGLRPPLGGAHALMNMVSLIVLFVFFSSYNILLSINCLMNSIGCCAPNKSNCGKLISSMKYMNFFPAGGAKFPFLYIVVLSISNMFLLFVFAEKLLDLYMKRPLFSFFK